MYSEERGTKKQRLNPSLTKEIKTALDPKHEELIAKKDNNIMELQRSIQAENGNQFDRRKDGNQFDFFMADNTEGLT